MWKTETDILLKTEGNIPIEIISKALEWQEVLLNNLPFFLTIVIISAAAIVTYRSNRKSIESQNNIASINRKEEHENKISEFRHKWIQEVRNTASELVQAIYDIQLYYDKSVKKRSQIEGITNPNLTSNDKEIIRDEVIIADKLLWANISLFHKIEAKFRLLFKSDDSESLKLFSYISDVKKNIKSLNVESIENEYASLIVFELQVILKREWEVTKDRTWHKNS